MCLGIPGRVVEIHDAGGIKMGKVDFGDVSREACLAYLPDICVGDFTVIHVGFAIMRLDEEQARDSLAAYREIADAVAGQGGE